MKQASLFLFGLACTFGSLSAASAGTSITVEGSGSFLRFARDGHAVYTTKATLSVVNGYVASSDGLRILPLTVAPPHASITIELDGTMSVGSKRIGQIVLAVFPEDAELDREGNYATSKAHPKLEAPGEGLAGVIRVSTSGQPLSAQPKKPKSDLQGPIPARGVAKTTSSASSKKAISGSITVNPATETDHDQIFLGSIATIESDAESKAKISQIDLGRTPPVGTPRIITTAELEARLRVAGFPVGAIEVSCPLGASVLRKAQAIVEADLLDAAAKEAKRRLKFAGELVLARALGDVLIPTGDYKISAGNPTQTAETVSVPLSVTINGKEVLSRIATLKPGDGSVQVRPYEAVKIRLIRNGAVVEVSGKSRSSGWLGQTIAVQSDTGATFSGTIAEAGVVEVRL